MEQIFTFLGLVVVAVVANGYLCFVKIVYAAMYECDGSQTEKEVTSVDLTNTHQTTAKRNHWLNAAVF